MGVQYLNGTTFNLRKTRAQDDRAIYWALNGKCDLVTRGCTLTYDSNAIYIAAGEFICRGGNVNVTATSSVDIPSVQSATKYSLVFEIDLSQTNTENQFNQGQFKLISGGASYPTLTQQDLDGSGTIYQMLFADIDIDTTGITALNDMRPVKGRTVAFTVAGWTSSNNMWVQTVRCAGVTSDSSPIYDLFLDDSLTQEQAQECIDSFLCVSKLTTSNTAVTLVCVSDKPLYEFSIVIEG